MADVSRVDKYTCNLNLSSSFLRLKPNNNYSIDYSIFSTAGQF